MPVFSTVPAKILFAMAKTQPCHIGFSVSSMTDSVQSSILRGRPFGGVGMLIRKDIAVNMKCLLNIDTCIVLQIDSILFCNVYLPPPGLCGI